MRWDKRSLNERFFEKINKTDSCWIWSGVILNSGYGQFCLSRVDGIQKKVLAHRFSYELSKGEIPQGLHIDHLCKKRTCVNPDHLEAVSPKENNHRSDCASTKNLNKTHCINGHPFCEKNTIFLKNGKRVCHECRKKYDREYKKRNS